LGAKKTLVSKFSSLNSLKKARFGDKKKARLAALLLVGTTYAISRMFALTKVSSSFPPFDHSLPLFHSSIFLLQKPKELARSVTKGITAQLDIIGGKLVGL